MNRTRLISFALACLLAFAPLATTAQTKARQPEGAVSAHGNTDAITAAQLKDYLRFIASDELEGRDTPSRGLEVAALFIATNLSRWGLKPAGEGGTFFQPVALRRTRVDTLATNVEINGQPFTFGEDFLASATAANVTAPVVYAGHGWMLKAKNIDAYTGLDVKDKIVVVTGGLPKGVSFKDLEGKAGTDYANPQAYARARGAKALIVIPGVSTLANWSQLQRNFVEKGAISLAESGPRGGALMPVIYASVKLLGALFQGEKNNGAVVFSRAVSGDPVEPFELSAAKKVTLNVAVKTEPAMARNIVAVLEGSDPVLKNEYVAVGAHYDHVGVGSPVKGDAIYNGADDDGSGTTAVLALAEAFVKGPRPKRSILFVWHCGEEKGLLGSEYFTGHPTVPLGQIVAQLNIDMIGRTRKEDDTNPENQELVRPGEIYVIGSKMMSTELGELSEAVNNSYLKLKFNYKYDDPKDPNRFFFRSDHFNYAQKGVPIIFYFDGVHEDYHRPSDSVDKIDFAQMERVARTIYATAWELANRAARVKVDKKLPEELTER